MNTIRATVFLIVLSLSGGCVTVAPNDTECEGAKLRQITIVYQRHSKITVSPDTKSVDRGDAINYKVRGLKPRPFKAKGTKAPDASVSFAWLNADGEGGTSRNGNSHIVCVPVDQQSGDYEYMIEIEGVGTLDPVVHVNE